ncbi:copper amine oxidase N-terminal domain-containing protein [Paenibacillus hunanensis]|uniref:copper amine oxidase N-terminal domain-containing protein n=1 Tax=Paenibacillus hunanensis TaxID=539262 RepID=UPI002025E5D4|nr:copper amine oxidase N-terminal domain-containing protein [Paenibacillus hunanensis]MCL9660707.1 copper amine oxidase N-terminal domain-containing protein [Paenibacillus hunanensis]
MKLSKSIYILAVLMLCMLLHAPQAHASLEQPEVYVNNENVDMHAVVSAAGITYVPFRTVFEKLHMNVDWDNTKKSVTATNDHTTITLTAYSDKAYVNGQEFDLLEPPIYNQDDQLFYVNLRFVAEASGAQVTWITKDDNARIYIKIPN